MKNGISKLLMVAAAVMLTVGLSVVAQGATGQMVTLVAGKAETVVLPEPAADILVANPAIADVGSLRADRLYVVGRGIGDTNILAFDAQGKQIADIAVTVGVDDASLRKSLKELFPRERIELRTVGNNIILKGQVSTPVVANQVRDFATRYIGQAAINRTLVDLMTVRGEQQVMLKVKVLEVKRDLLREMGIAFSDAAGGAGLNQALGHTNQVNTSLLTRPLFGLSPEQFGTGIISMAARGNFGPIDIQLDGLETDGLVSTLAEPTLTAVSGESAGFLAGGEFPIPVARDQQGNVTLEFRQFGVSLAFIPTVLGEDRISLQLTSEVSERSDAEGISLQGAIIPGLAVRRAQTTVQMASGGTIMMAGLLRSRSAEGLNGLPGFKDLPIIGELFKSRSFRRGESELVFLVTPYLVEPFADQQAERVTRNDNDLLHSILETGKDLPEPVTGPATMPRRGPPPAPAAAPLPVLEKDSMPMPAKKASYRRQGEENRMAGGKKDDNGIWKPRSQRERERLAEARARYVQQQQQEPGLIGAPVADVEPAPVMPPDHPALTLPVGKEKLSMAGEISMDITPLPRRKPGMARKQTAAADPVEADILQSLPRAAEKLKAGEEKPSEPAKLGAIEPASGTDEGKKGEVASVDVVLTAPLPRRKPFLPETATALSDTFMNSLKKIYGNRVSAKLGEDESYGYIVD